jgi:hypothetical protein
MINVNYAHVIGIGRISVKHQGASNLQIDFLASSGIAWPNPDPKMVIRYIDFDSIATLARAYLETRRRTGPCVKAHWSSSGKVPMLPSEPQLTNIVSAGQLPCMMDAASSLQGCVPVSCREGSGPRPCFLAGERIAPAFAALHMLADGLLFELVAGFGTLIYMPCPR